MDKIISYIVVPLGVTIEKGIPQIDNPVKEQLEKGYQPYGDPFYHPTIGIMQAMVKYGPSSRVAGGKEKDPPTLNEVG